MTDVLFFSRQAEENNNQMRDDLGDKSTLIRSLLIIKKSRACTRPAFSISYGKVAYLRLLSVNIQGN